MYKIDNLSEIEEQYREEKERFLKAIEQNEPLRLRDLINSTMYEGIDEIDDDDVVQVWDEDAIVAEGHWYEDRILALADRTGTAERRRGIFYFFLEPDEGEACA